MNIPKIPVGDWFASAVDFFVSQFSYITRAISKSLKISINTFVELLSDVHPLVLIVFSTVAIWYFFGKKAGITTLLGLLFLWNQQLWVPTLETVVMVAIATIMAVIIGFPLGMISGVYPGFFRILAPILNFMQTMPAFVYLIPTIAFFGLGSVSAIFSTLIFSLPPLIRLTAQGIRDVPKELKEAADAFGSTRLQKLFKLQLPLAKPLIMAGLHQTMMLALSMVVIAAMIGAKGLGAEVWRSIQRLDLALGFEAGLGIVVLALILDRITFQASRVNR